MAVTRIILWLGNAFLFCAIIMGLTGAAGFLLREASMSVVFLFFSLIAALLGGALVFMTRNSPSRETSKDAMIFLLLFWIFVPIVFALPYVVCGVTPTFSRAYFESVSAFSTTGASTLIAEDIPRTFLLWRSLLQWGGGVMTATFAVVILAALNLSGSGVHRSKLFTLRRGELFSRLIGVGRIIALIYGFIAAICFVGLLVSGTQIFESLCLSLSAISTGGLTPQNGPLSGYVSRFGVLILAITCFFGASNVAVLWDFARLKSWRKGHKLFLNLEHRGLLVLIAALILFGLFHAGIKQFYTVLIEAIFMVSTAGFNYRPAGIETLPSALLIIIALIGGSAISTAGGLKIIRGILLLSHAGTDIDRMSHPSRVKLVRFRGQILPDQAFLSVWMYFFGYTLVFAAGIVALGAAGMAYPVAVSASAASLSNMGPLLPATFPLSPYAEMNGLQLGILSSLMLFGRVEVLAAMAAFTPALWRQ
ncbi:MAG: potassium transporter TrkG [Robiginitomaculum sp.]